jgi:2-methylisoborneol synthase
MSMLNRVAAPAARHEAAALAAALLAAPPSAPASLRLYPAKPVLSGPRGLGTSSLRPVPPRPDTGGAQNAAVPELYSPPALRDDPALGELVNERLLAWAEEIGLYRDSLDHVREANFGRLIMLAHPESEDPDRLLAAAKCALAEWATDDVYCDDESEGARPDLLGGRLGMAYAAIDPPEIGAQRQPSLDAALREDPVRVALSSALGHIAQYAAPGQVNRLRFELTALFNGYNTEGSWRRTDFVPPVWQYLAERQQNSFMPTIAVVDVVGGYHLSATEYGAPPVRRAVLMAALAATLVNDLYSMSKEQRGAQYDYNLPTLIAAEEQCSAGEAVRRAAALHDELVRAYEREAAVLAAAGSPAQARFLAGVWAWLGGNREWHRTTAHYATARDKESTR